MNPTEMAEAVERARCGEREGLSEIYEAFSRRVLGLCRHLLGSPDAAEDARSDVFLRLPRALDRYDPALPFATVIGGPIAILLLAVTLVGLPLALILLGLYLLALVRRARSWWASRSDGCW